MKQGYSTDITDKEWCVIYRYFPRSKKQGRPMEHLKKMTSFGNGQGSKLVVKRNQVLELLTANRSKQLI